jgi:hypothetical protein
MQAPATRLSPFFPDPGTQTWLRIGYVKLDLLDDFGKNLGDFIS